VKLVHLVDFIIKKFVTMHGHMNVKLFLSNLFIYLKRHNPTPLISYNRLYLGITSCNRVLHRTLLTSTQHIYR